MLQQRKKIQDNAHVRNTDKAEISVAHTVIDNELRKCIDIIPIILVLTYQDILFLQVWYRNRCRSSVSSGCQASYF